MGKQQMEIPGTERPKIKPIEEAAEAYRAIRDKRMRLTEQEVTARTNLITVMEKNRDKLSVDSEGSAIYCYEDEMVILSEKATVKVRTASNDGGEDDD